MTLSARGPATPVRVVLAASEPGLRTLVRRSLPATDYQVIEVAPEDLEACAVAARAADVVLVAEGPGSPPGLQLVSRVREENEPPPLLLVAARSDPALDRAALAHGVAGFLEQDRLDGQLLERTLRYALAQRQETLRISRLAKYDPLTGLANRSLFEDRLGRALARARRSGRLVAVMVLDLNAFKAINDELGHPAGDRLLKIMAARLTGRLRETDTIARLGGDEFALVIEDLARPQYAMLVARKVMDAVVPPTVLAERSVQLSASLGIALYPEDGATAAVLLARADQAMYRAKADGGHACRFCRADPAARVQAAGLLEGDLKEALTDGLDLCFRPQLPLGPKGGAVTVSALPIWRHPTEGTIDAARFLPLAEDAGLLARVMDWILERGCRQLEDWRAAGFDRLRLGLPLVSRRQLAWDDLPGRLARARRGLDPGALELEVPEDQVLADLEAGGAGLAHVRASGVRIALTGSGSGTLPLAPLGSGTIDTVKTALADLPGPPDQAGPAAILKAVLGCARALGLRSVVAGEIDPAGEALLAELGCDAIEPLAALDLADTSVWLSAALAGEEAGAVPRRAARSA